MVKPVVRCVWCGRPLRKPESVKRRQGDHCRRKHGEQLSFPWAEEVDTLGEWPRTDIDRLDQVFAEMYSSLQPERFRRWRAGEICGCRQELKTEEEKRAGVCKTCLTIGFRTPRNLARNKVAR